VRRCRNEPPEICAREEDCRRVFAVTRGQDIYDAVPVFITDPKELDQTAGSLHCGTLLMSKLVKKYLDGASNTKIAMTVKAAI